MTGDFTDPDVRRAMAEEDSMYWASYRPVAPKSWRWEAWFKVRCWFFRVGR